MTTLVYLHKIFIIESFMCRFEFAKFSKTVEDDFNRVINVIKGGHLHDKREFEIEGYKYYYVTDLNIKSVFDMINGYYIEKPKKYKRLEGFFEDEQIIRHEYIYPGSRKIKYGFYLNGKIHSGKETYSSLQEFVSTHLKSERINLHGLKGVSYENRQLYEKDGITDDYAWDNCMCLMFKYPYINQWISTRELLKLRE